ncbi:hypothetical protein OIU76_009544 [Salix suchowensis]|nr:hypothetical protein OIU76_009544 [Salix suchowensis]
MDSTENGHHRLLYKPHPSIVHLFPCRRKLQHGQGNIFTPDE